MICKKCHPIMGHKLIQSGQPDPKSKICSVCNALHDSNGKLFDPSVKKTVKSGVVCAICGSDNITIYPVAKVYACIDCGHLGEYKPEPKNHNLGVWILTP